METGGERTRERLLGVAEEHWSPTAARSTSIAWPPRPGSPSAGCTTTSPLRRPCWRRWSRPFTTATTAGSVRRSGPLEELGSTRRERVRRAVRFYYDQPLASRAPRPGRRRRDVARVDGDGSNSRRGLRRRTSAKPSARAGYRASSTAPRGRDAHGGRGAGARQALEQSPRPPADELASLLWTMVAGVVGLARRTDNGSTPLAGGRSPRGLVVWVVRCS